MKNESKFIVVSNIVTLVCAILALIFLLMGDVDVKNPIIWIMVALILSSISSLVAQISNTKKKKK